MIEVTIQLTEELVELLRRDEKYIRSITDDGADLKRVPVSMAARLVLDALPEPVRPIAVRDTVTNASGWFRWVGVVTAIDEPGEWALVEWNNTRGLVFRDVARVAELRHAPAEVES